MIDSDKVMVFLPWDDGVVRRMYVEPFSFKLKGGFLVKQFIPELEENHD